MPPAIFFQPPLNDEERVFFQEKMTREEAAVLAGIPNGESSNLTVEKYLKRIAFAELGRE